MKYLVFMFVFLISFLFPVVHFAQNVLPPKNITSASFDQVETDDALQDDPPQRLTNYWVGGWSTAWGGGINWSLGHVPTSTENVYIDSGLPRYPFINSSSTYSCNSVFMESGTSLNLQGTLYITYDLTCYGTLNLNNSVAELNVDDDLSFHSGSTLNIPYDGAEIYIYDDLICHNGSSVFPDYGNIVLTGSDSNIILNNYISIFNLRISGDYCERSSGTSALAIKNSLSIDSSSTYVSSVNSVTYIHGNLWVGSTGFYNFDDGTVMFEGGNYQTYLYSNSNCYFNHLEIHKDTGFAVFLMDSIRVYGHLSIGGGTLDSNNYSIILHGNWLENCGPDGFDESAGSGAQITFAGNTDQLIIGNEEFNILWNYSPTRYLIIYDSADVTAQSYYHSTGNLQVNSGSSFTANLGLENLDGIFNVSGYLDLTLSSTFSADISNNVTVNVGGEFHIHGGLSPSYVHDGANLNPDGLLYFHDIGLEILVGANGNMNSGDIYVAGDFKVYETYYSLYGGSVHFVGSGDSYFLPPSSGFTGLHINKVSTNDDVHVVSRGFSLMGELFLENGNLMMWGYDINLHDNAQISDQLIMQGGSVYITPDMEIIITDGGWLSLNGTSTDLAYISRIGATGNYNLTVEDGGQLGAEYTVFEYMGPQGINLQSGSIVEHSKCFTHCTFRYGADAGTLLTINNDQNLLLYGVNFPANTWSGNYNITKTNDEGNILFVLASGSFSGAANESDSFSRIEWGTTIPPVTDLNIWLIDNPGNEQLNLQAFFPYEGLKYTLYVSTVGPDGPWDIYSIGSTSVSHVWSYFPTEPKAFFKIILWQE